MKPNPEQPSGLEMEAIKVTRWYTEPDIANVLLFMAILVFLAGAGLKKGEFCKSMMKATRSTATKTSQSASEALRMPLRVKESNVGARKSAQASGVSTDKASSINRRGQSSKDLRKGQALWDATVEGNKSGVLDHLATGNFDNINRIQKWHGSPLCAACEGEVSR